MTKGQFRKKLGEVTRRPEPRTTPIRNRNGKQGIGKANNYEYIPFAPRKNVIIVIILKEKQEEAKSHT